MEYQQPPGPPAVPLQDAHHDDVLGALHTAGLYLGRHRRRGLHSIRCPWAELHSNRDPEAVVIEPGQVQLQGGASGASTRTALIMVSAIF
jgi:hypothetical protein